tara:strand:- start:52 stop:171 length:120 start_codon:yes stop_codon:yes gene_type:complete
MGKRYHGRPGMGVRRLKCGITVQYTPGTMGGWISERLYR